MPLIFNTYIAIVINALFTGIGVAIGQPIGQLIWKRYIHKTVKKIHKTVKTKVVK